MLRIEAFIQAPARSGRTGHHRLPWGNPAALRRVLQPWPQPAISGSTKSFPTETEIDLRLEDYLAYLADDDRIRLIACYVEDIQEILTDSSKHSKGYGQKARTAHPPKGRQNRAGVQRRQRATQIAMASNYAIWSAAVRRHGGLLVDDFEQLMNLAMLGTAKKLPGGRRVGFWVRAAVFGIICRPGRFRGDRASRTGPRAQQMINEKIRGVNTSTTNPVDLGAFGFDLNVMLHTMQAMDQDDNIDVIIPTLMSNTSSRPR